MNQAQVIELLLQSLEHERGGVKVYETAIQCALERDLKKEWTKYLEETREHEAVLMEVCAALEIDPEAEVPGREVVRIVGAALVTAMQTAKATATPEGAQLVACECVVLAETKDHQDWELIGQLAKKGSGDGVAALQQAYDRVEDQEDEHLYHSKGWCRELWIKSLGMKAVIPPPEETRDVKTAIEAARAKQERKQ